LNQLPREIAQDQLGFQGADLIGVGRATDSRLVIEGDPRIRALEPLDRDTVDAVIWRLSKTKALLLDRPSSLRRTGHRARITRSNKALEQGWLLVEPEQRFGYRLRGVGALL
jgi:hypothetical protein